MVSPRLKKFIDQVVGPVPLLHRLEAVMDVTGFLDQDAVLVILLPEENVPQVELLDLVCHNEQSPAVSRARHIKSGPCPVPPEVYEARKLGANLARNAPTKPQNTPFKTPLAISGSIW